MSSETDRLEQQAESHRNHLDETLSALKGRLSLGQIVDEMSGYVKASGGAEMANNLSRQVRDNPLALGLVGAGLAWLLLGDSARSGSSHLARRAGHWRDRAYDRFGEAFPHHDDDDDMGDVIAEGMSSASDPIDGYDPGPYGTARAPSSGSSRSMHSDWDRTPSQGISGRKGLGQRAGEAFSGVGAKASNAYDRATGAYGSARDRASAGYASAARRGSDAAHYASDNARYYGHEAARRGRQMQRSFLDTLQEQPLVVGAVAIAVGAAIGAAMPSTRQEDEYLGDARDRLRDEALAGGRDLYERGEEVAMSAYEAASKKAEEEGLKPKSGDEKTLARKLTDVGEAAAEAAKSEADRKNLT